MNDESGVSRGDQKPDEGGIYEGHVGTFHFEVVKVGGLQK